MLPIKSIFRILFISLLGLIGVALVYVGGNVAWQGGDVGGVLMLLAMGGMLVASAWWLLFLAPPQPVSRQTPAIPPAPRSGEKTHDDKPAAVRVAKRHQRLIDDAPIPAATPTELRAALLGIGYRRIAGATWQDACADEHWANLCVFLHCERDKLEMGSSEDVDGLYLTREEAEAAVSASPQAANPYTWKVFVSASALQYLSDDRKALPHLVRAIKQQLFALPDGDCTGTLVELKSWQAGKKAWLDGSGKNIVLFEDENVLGGPMFSNEPQTGVFKSASGSGLFDESGAIVVPPRYEEIEHFYNGLAAAKLNGLWGFLDMREHWQIEPRFVEVGGFYNEAHSKARTANGWGLIDRQGAWIVADRYAEIAWLNRYRDGIRIAAVRQTEAGLWGAIQLGLNESRPAQEGEQPTVEALPALCTETLVVDCVCATEDEAEERVHDYLEARQAKRESVSRLREATEAVDYHCNYCGKKIGDYNALRAAGFHVDKYERVYCGNDCSTKAFMGASREYEGRGGDY